MHTHRTTCLYGMILKGSPEVLSLFEFHNPKISKPALIHTFMKYNNELRFFKGNGGKNYRRNLYSWGSLKSYPSFIYSQLPNTFLLNNLTSFALGIILWENFESFETNSGGIFCFGHEFDQSQEFWWLVGVGA